MNFDWLRMNPDYPYDRSQLEARRGEAETWIRVASERGKADHPAAQVCRENLALIKRLEDGRAA